MGNTSFSQFREELAELVARFDKNVTHFRSAAYDESSLRNDFLTPFWRALGWDVENKAGLTQLLREVQVESRIEQDGKRADYLLRTDGIDRLTCEAKRPHERDLSRWHYQAQRYAFNLRLLIATLGNFETFQVFVVGGKPDRARPWAICKEWHYTEYVDQAIDLWELFGRDSVASNSIDKYVARLPKREIADKGRQGWLIPPERVRTVDVEFLEYIEQKREILAKLIVDANTDTNWEAEPVLLNECVQRVLAVC